MSDAGARAWAFRAAVEVEAQLRFSRLAERISRLDAGSPVAAMAREAAADEARHAVLCAGLVGGPVPAISLREIAPASLGGREQVLYEVVAACCLAETESCATLTVLLERQLRPDVREVVRQIARDEVRHAQLGWAHLARERDRGDVAFLARWVPVMLEGSVLPELFEPDAPEDASSLGVLPASVRLQVFAAALADVVFPGLSRLGVDIGPARAWSDRRLGPQGPG